MAIPSEIPNWGNLDDYTIVPIENDTSFILQADFSLLNGFNVYILRDNQRIDVAPDYYTVDGQVIRFAKAFGNKVMDGDIVRVEQRKAHS